MNILSIYPVKDVKRQDLLTKLCFCNKYFLPPANLKRSRLVVNGTGQSLTSEGAS